jgi:hypothetical protein
MDFQAAAVEKVAALEAVLLLLHECLVESK